MSFPKYAEYVDSGVEWLGTVPSHWKIATLRRAIKSVSNGTTATQVDESENTIPVTRIETISSGKINYEKVGHVEKSEVIKPFMLQRGDIILSHINSLSMVGNAAIYDGLKPLAHGMNLLRLKVDRLYIDSKWLLHWLKSKNVRQEMESRAKPAINQASISTASIKDVPIPLIPHAEQTQIARFLDHETAKIDALIAEQKRLIELLKEKRQAVISHAVTKGLDPNVPMKDSGVEWLGEVPAHWEVRKLKYCASLVTTKGASRENVISLENIEGGTGRFISTVSEFSGEGVIFEPQDVLFGKLRPYLAKVHLARTSGIALGDILVFRATEEFAPEFLFFMLISQGFIDEVNQSSYGTKMPRANPEYILGLFVTAPPREEQLEIANYLVNAQYDKILPTILNANRLMKLLEERRSALISAAVTGNIDVRDWQPPADENAFDEEVQKAGLEASA